MSEPDRRYGYTGAAKTASAAFTEAGSLLLAVKVLQMLRKREKKEQTEGFPAALTS